MNVAFAPTAKRNLVMTHNGRMINMHRGKYRTADKQEVKFLLNSQEYKRGDFEMVTAPELVEPWLAGKQPDKLTAELLADVTNEGLVMIAKHLQLRNHGNYPTVIRAIAEGEYIDNKISAILAEHKRETPAENLIKKAKDLNVIGKNGPWNIFKNPETGEEETHGKSVNDISMFVEQNRDLVIKAIELAEEKDDDV